MGMRWRAEISRCGQYRYLLEGLTPDKPLIRSRILVVCMLNSSTADGSKTDPTVRWLIGFARKHGYDAIRIVNLAAYRTPSIREMLAVADPHGSENVTYLIRYCAGNDVLCAWGNHGPQLPRYDDMLKGLNLARLFCLGTNKNGSPMHPLRRSHSLELRPWPAVLGQETS